MTRTHRLPVMLLSVVAVLAAATPSVLAQDGTRYSVTIKNLTSGQPLTPALLATHDPAVSVFEVGDAASEGVVQIAENGNLMPLTEALEATDGVHEVVAGGMPILPGESATLEILANEGEVLSWVSMLICTNDGFTGLHGLELSRTTVATNAYEATSEMNTEALADIVPPCQALVGVSSNAPGTGMSDPALAEDGVIAAHSGISGEADLQVDPHGWTDPVAEVTIAIATGMPNTALGASSGAMALLVIAGLVGVSGAAILALRRVRR